MDDTDKLDFLYEWAVWGHLSSKRDYELILLKGHLMLETALETTLKRNNISNNGYSFFRKLSLLKIAISADSHDLLIMDSLQMINAMRNKLAHEFFYDALESDLTKWSETIHCNFKGEKFTKFTARTKVVHAFSILTINLLRIKLTELNGNANSNNT